MAEQDERLLKPEEILDADTAFKLVRKLVGQGNKVSIEHIINGVKPTGYYQVAQLANGQVCPECYGTGEGYVTKCPTCQGTGKDDKKLEKN